MLYTSCYQFHSCSITNLFLGIFQYLHAKLPFKANSPLISNKEQYWLFTEYKCVLNNHQYLEVWTENLCKSILNSLEYWKKYKRMLLCGLTYILSYRVAVLLRYIDSLLPYHVFIFNGHATFLILPILVELILNKYIMLLLNIHNTLKKVS